MSTTLIVLVVIGIIVIFALYSFKESYNFPYNPVLNKISKNFSIIDPKYGKIPLKEGDSSYTENKDVITLCLKDPKTNKYYDFNTLMYVSLHELAHVSSTSHGHGDEFKDNFAKLLKRAESLGIYNSNLPIPVSYCGVNSENNDD